LVVVVVMMVVSPLAAAEPAASGNAPPAWVASAVVQVDAYEHRSWGAVVGDGRSVVVPFAAIEVDRPGWPDAIVIDSNGARLDAWIVATDRKAGLALLGVGRVITATPLRPIARVLAAGAPVGVSFEDGAPIVDEQGRLVAIMGVSGFSERKPHDVIDALARMLTPATDTAGTQPAPPRERRRWIFYGGGSFNTDVATKGGVWFGGTASIGARWRDLIELRLDAQTTFLLPSAKHRECGEPPCFAGGRGVLTPSIGTRIRLGGLGGSREQSIALTPSIGYALGAQVAYRDSGAPVFDVESPSTWGLLAPGVALSIGLFEAHVRVRLPRGEVTAPTFELALAGFYF